MRVPCVCGDPAAREPCQPGFCDDFGGLSPLPSRTCQGERPATQVMAGAVSPRCFPAPIAQMHLPVIPGEPLARPGTQSTRVADSAWSLVFALGPGSARSTASLGRDDKRWLAATSRKKAPLHLLRTPMLPRWRSARWRSEEGRTRHVPTAGSPEGSRWHQHKARSGRVPRLSRVQIGSEPIRSVTAPRTGSRGRSLNASGMLRTRVSHPVRTCLPPCPHCARDASGSGCPTRASPDASRDALTGWMRGLWRMPQHRG